MAEDISKIKSGVLKSVLKEIGKGKDDAFTKVANEEMAKAREGKGLIGGAFAAAKAKSRVAEEYSIATKGTMGKRTAFFEGLLGRDLGNLVKDLGLEKMESPEKIKEVRAKFGLDKKEKGDRGGVGKLAKPLSLILRNVIQTQKMVRGIEKTLTKPSIKAGYTFDPRMAGGGRYKNTEGKLVSSKEALTGGGERTAALSAAIGADEQPIVKLTEFLEEKFKDFDAKKLKETTDSIKFSLNGMTPTMGLLSVHDKLNLLLEKAGTDLLDDMDIDSDGKKKKTPKKKPGRFRKKLGRIGRGISRIGGRVLTAATSTPAIAAAGAVAVTAAGAYALDKGMTKVGEEAKGAMDQLEKKYGIKTIYKNGMAIGYEIRGKKYDLNNLPPEYQDLINAYGPGDKRNKTARDALARIKADPEKYRKLELGYKPTVAPKAAPAAAAPTAAGAPTAAPSATVSAAKPAALPGAATVAAATTTAAAIPAAAGGAAAPSAPPTSGGPPRRLGPAAAARGKISAAEGRNAALAAAAKAGITGPHLAQFMAQIDHESGGFKVVEENLRYSAKRLLEIFPKYYKDPAQAEADAYSPIAIANRVYANRMGNGPPESGDGYKYRGRGLIQLTGKDNYKRFGQLAGVDLVSNPDMAGSLGTAADIAAAFYKKNVMDKGIDPQNTAKVTKAINGGSIGLSHRESLFASYMKDAGSLQPSGQMLASGTEPEPSAVAKGQDVKVGGGASGAAPPKDKQQMVASSQATPATPAAAAPAASPSLAPVQNTTGAQVAQGSSQLETSKMVAQASPPAPVVVNNNSGGGNQQPIQSPKTPMPKASSRSSESSFSRALAKDFSHPTSFTSAIVG